METYATAAEVPSALVEHQQAHIPRAITHYVDELRAADCSEALIALQALLRGDGDTLLGSLKKCPPETFLYWRKTTLLHIAAAFGADMVALLVERAGLRVDARNENGSTPLHIACEEAKEDISRLLVQLGADVDAQDIFGNTPLMRGVLSKNSRAVPLMTELGANPYILNFSARTPMEVLEEQRSFGLISLLSTIGHSLLYIPRKLCCPRAAQQENTHSGNQTNNFQSEIRPLMPVAVPLDESEGNQEEQQLIAQPEPIREAEPIGLRTPPVLRRQGPWPPKLGLFLLILFIGWVIVTVFGYSQIVGPKKKSAGLLIWTGIILYVLQLIEAISFGRRYLTKCISSDRAFVESCSQLAQPTVLTFEISCYHWETHTETYRDSRGRTETRTRQEKVVTHTASQDVRFDEFWILQDSFLTFSGICLVGYESEYILADNETKRKFEQLRKSFISQNNRDINYDFKVSDGYNPPSGCVALDGLASVRLINFAAYIWISLLVLSVPYRMWLNSVSSKQTIRIKRYLWKA